jgi:hypothetical protein
LINLFAGCPAPATPVTGAATPPDAAPVIGPNPTDASAARPNPTDESAARR